MSSALRKIKTVKKNHSLKRILQDEVKRIRLVLLVCGVLFIGLSFYFSQLSASSDRAIKLGNYKSGDIVSFAQEPVKVDNAFLKNQGKDKIKASPLRILIPELSLDLPIKEAKIIKGYWEVFPESAGWGSGSAYPGEIGNQVIFAHAKEGLFQPLKKARLGQLIYIITKEKWFFYHIAEIKEVTPDNLSAISPTIDETLTLYTCSGFSDSKRLIVIAKRVIQ
jgi:LPXTG-site transpeptidase (sortase) family protein